MSRIGRLPVTIPSGVQVEIDADRVDRQRGMDVTVVTTATTDEEGRSLLRRLGFPFKEG